MYKWQRERVDILMEGVQIHKYFAKKSICLMHNKNAMKLFSCSLVSTLFCFGVVAVARWHWCGDRHQQYSDAGELPASVGGDRVIIPPSITCPGMHFSTHTNINAHIGINQISIGKLLKTKIQVAVQSLVGAGRLPLWPNFLSLYCL